MIFSLIKGGLADNLIKENEIELKFLEKADFKGDDKFNSIVKLLDTRLFNVVKYKSNYEFSWSFQDYHIKNTQSMKIKTDD